MRILRENQRLNKVEKIKLERHPLEVRQAILETYSRNLAAMDEVPGEVERLKWVGIYPQKQGGRGGLRGSRRSRSPWPCCAPRASTTRS